MLWVEEGFIDTAVKTSETGYLQNLVKSMEDLRLIMIFLLEIIQLYCTI